MASQFEKQLRKYTILKNVLLVAFVIWLFLFLPTISQPLWRGIRYVYNILFDSFLFIDPWLAVLIGFTVFWYGLILMAPNSFFLPLVWLRWRRLDRMKKYEHAIPLAKSLMNEYSPWGESVCDSFYSFLGLKKERDFDNGLLDELMAIPDSTALKSLSHSDGATQTRCMDFLARIVSPREVITDKHWLLLENFAKVTKPAVAADFNRRYAPLAAKYEALFSIVQAARSCFHPCAGGIEDSRLFGLSKYFSSKTLSRLKSIKSVEMDPQAVDMLKSLGASDSGKFLDALFSFCVNGNHHKDAHKISEDVWIYLITFVQKVYGCHGSFMENKLRSKFQSLTCVPEKSEIKECYEALNMPEGCQLDVVRKVCYELSVNLGEQLEAEQISQEEYDRKTSLYRKAADKIAVWGDLHYWHFEYWEALVCKVCGMNLDARDLQKKILEEEHKTSAIDKLDRLWYDNEMTWALRELGRKYDEEKKTIVKLLFRLAVTSDGIRDDEWKFLQQVMTSARLGYNLKRYLLKQYEALRVSGYASSSRENREHKENREENLDACYALLQVPLDSSLEEVKKSYYALAKLHHPDMPQNADRKEECEALMAKLNEAYEKICG